jgi:hypothetical protein
LGGAMGVNTPPILFLPNNRFLATELKRDKIKKIQIFSK